MASVARRLAGRGLRRYGKLYHDIRDDPAAVHRFGEVDEVIGYYENPMGTTPQIILITDAGLRFPNNPDLPSVDYDDIVAVGLPLKVESGPREMRLRLSSGMQVVVPVEGRDGKYQDLAQMSHFLVRTVELVRGVQLPDIGGFET